MKVWGTCEKRGNIVDIIIIVMKFAGTNNRSETILSILGLSHWIWCCPFGGLTA